MTYAFPESLTPLRKYLKSKGLEGDSVKTSRQAAFVAQQLLGTRVKFPPQGQDMTPVLMEIQKAVPAQKNAGARVHPAPAEERVTREGEPDRAKRKHRPHHVAVQCDFSRGVHIFADGACEPNPGAGGWGVVVYRDGVEVFIQSGGNPETTNNQMELTALLVAIEKAGKLAQVEPVKSGTTCPEITIWSDSQYCVNGVNDWLAGWKRNGWNRKKPNSPNRAAGEIKNIELWQAIDEALGDVSKTAHVSIRWVKGHAGIAGNERADELAEMGRQTAGTACSASHAEDLDERYRQIMGAA